jgi:hypothetical protein
MSVLDTGTIIRRIDELFGASLPKDTAANIYSAAVEKYQATLTLATAVYGAGSLQTQTLLRAADAAQREVGHVSHNFPRHVPLVVEGTLRALRADVEAGLVGNLARRATCSPTC